MVIPKFNSRGELPPGEHPASLDEIEERFATNPVRRNQFSGLKRAARALARAGCSTLWLDGSYITSKSEPQDYDATFDGDTVDWVALGLAEPEILDFDAPRHTQKRAFGGELVPTLGVGVDYVEFFQSNRDGGRKGIVRVDLAGLS